MRSPWAHRGDDPQPTGVDADGPRILFPFLAVALSQHALDASLRLARADSATLLPVFLALVPRHVPLDTALPRQAGIAVASEEAIEQRAAAFGVAVESRIERGRTHRHALARAIRTERHDRIVIAAAAPHGHGFRPEDVAWLLAHAPGEIIVLRPGAEDPLPELEYADELDPATSTRGTVALPSAFD